MNHRFCSMVLVTLALLPGCGFFPESTFDLAPTSRLPAWFTLPPGLKREDISVLVSYYISPTGPTATFAAFGPGRQQLLKVSAIVRDAEPLHLKNPPSGFPPGYPSYNVVTVNGITDVLEHRKLEPIVYITDDVAVRQELGIPANNPLERTRW